MKVWKQPPAPQFSSPFTQIQKEKVNKRNSTILKHKKKSKITLVAPDGPVWDLDFRGR